MISARASGAIESPSRPLWPASRGAAKHRRCRAATCNEILVIICSCHGSAILLTDQRDGSEKISRRGKWRRDQRGTPSQGLVVAPSCRACCHGGAGIVR